jgi:CRP-like cAMP-binding protein
MQVDDHVFVTELCSRMHKVTFAKGSLIFQRGEIATHMFIIWTGVVEVMDGKVRPAAPWG